MIVRRELLLFKTACTDLLLRFLKIVSTHYTLLGSQNRLSLWEPKRLWSTFDDLLGRSCSHRMPSWRHSLPLRMSSYDWLFAGFSSTSYQLSALDHVSSQELRRIIITSAPKHVTWIHSLHSSSRSSWILYSPS